MRSVDCRLSGREVNFARSCTQRALALQAERARPASSKVPRPAVQPCRLETHRANRESAAFASWCYVTRWPTNLVRVRFSRLRRRHSAIELAAGDSESDIQRELSRTRNAATAKKFFKVPFRGLCKSPLKATSTVWRIGFIMTFWEYLSES